MFHIGCVCVASLLISIVLGGGSLELLGVSLNVLITTTCVLTVSVLSGGVGVSWGFNSLVTLLHRVLPHVSRGHACCSLAMFTTLPPFLSVGKTGQLVVTVQGPLSDGSLPRVMTTISDHCDNWCQWIMTSDQKTFLFFCH